MPPQLVVFDFDGTLAETRAAVATTVNAALAAHGWPRLAPEVVHGMMGLPLARCFEVAIPPYKRPVDVGPMVRWYQEHFVTLGAPLVEALPGAAAAVQAARDAGLAVGLATSREASTLRPLLAALGLEKGWATVVTCDRVTHGKPHPEALHLAMAEAGAAPDRTWMIGDTTWDVEMAVAAGVRPIGVTGGSHGREELVRAGAVEVLDGTGGLVALLHRG